jgi:prepilin-type N-terminal cleavage/methylation domain-containing protein
MIGRSRLTPTAKIDRLPIILGRFGLVRLVLNQNASSFPWELVCGVWEITLITTVLHPNVYLVKPMPMRLAKAGFTLTELLVAAAVSLILCGAAVTGLVMFQQMSQQMDERLVREAELQRALHLMATDIQEGQRIEAGAGTPLSGYSALFKSVRSDGSTISYYSTDRGTRVWGGPQILYRWDSRERRSYALIDRLADGVTVKSSDVCTAPDGFNPLVSGPAGVVVWVDGQSTAKICLLGYLAKSNKGIQASTMASTRVAP